MQFIFKSFSDENVRKAMQQKRSVLFLKVNRLEQELAALEERSKLMDSMFYDDKKFLEELRKDNSEYAEVLKEELTELKTFLHFIFSEETPTIDDLFKGNEVNSDILLHIPYLILVDFYEHNIYVKFNPSIFEGSNV